LGFPLGDFKEDKFIPHGGVVIFKNGIFYGFVNGETNDGYLMTDEGYEESRKIFSKFT
jgi:hypothetical protein